MSTLIIILLLIFCSSLLYGQLPHNSDTDSDSLLAETALKDSSLARAISFKSYKPLLLIKSEKSFKYQLIKLVLISQGKYLNYYQPTELLFEEINRFSERTRKKMLFLTIGGGVVSQSFMYGRKLLRKYNINFITPNLKGLSIYSRPLPFKPKPMFRLANYNDIYFVTCVNNGLFTLSQRKTAYYTSRGIYFKMTHSLCLIYSNVVYPYTEYYNFGVAIYKKWASFYFVYQKNFENPRWNRAYIDWQVRL